MQPDLTNYAAYVNVTVVSPTYGVTYIYFFSGLIWTFFYTALFLLVGGSLAGELACSGEVWSPFS